MKTSKKIQTFLSVLLMTGFLVAPGTPAFAGGLEGLSEGAGNVLDSIEKFVRDDTPFVQWKKDLYEKYGLLIKPYFKMDYELTSNVFLAPDDNSDHTDNIWRFKPGFQWMKEFSKGAVGGAYEAAFNYFTQFYQQNEVDQKFLVYTNLNPTERTYLRASERFEQVGATSGSSASGPVNYFDNTVDVVAGYKATDELTFEFGYQNFDRDFSSVVARRYSYNEDKYDYRMYYQYNAGLRFWTGFRLGQVEFVRDQSRDTFYYEFPVGVDANLPSGIVLHASAGLHHRNLENSSRNDLTHIVTNIYLQKTFNHDRTSVEGGFLRRPMESSFSTTTTYDEKLWYANIKHLLTPRLRGRANLYVGNRDWEERVFTGTRITVGGVTFVVPPTQVKRDDDVFGMGFGFDYNLRKWLILHADYSYSRRNSNISALDFTENQMTLGATVPL